MSSLKISTFVFEKVQETLLNAECIETVYLRFGLDGNFGNEYIKVSYSIKPSESYYTLSKTEQSKLFNGSPDSIFPISTYSTTGKGNFKKELLRFLEFKNIYSTLASYITLQLEHALPPTASIKIQGIDNWPYANYAEKHLSSPLNSNSKRSHNRAFSDDISQWSRLHELAHNTRKIASEQKEYLCITDEEIANRFDIDLNEFRYLLLRHEIPIKISGIKTIDKITIHTIELQNALKKDIRNAQYDGPIYVHFRLISYLYDTYLEDEKTTLIQDQASKFLESFIIQEGDILQLKDDRIVVASAIEIGPYNEVIVNYSILKVDLTISTRQRRIPCKDVSYVVKKEDFLEYKNHTSSNRIVLLKKWMTRKKKKVDYSPFEPNLMAE